jgi:hypothetical protein
MQQARDVLGRVCEASRLEPGRAQEERAALPLAADLGGRARVAAAAAAAAAAASS